MVVYGSSPVMPEGPRAHAWTGTFKIIAAAIARHPLAPEKGTGGEWQWPAPGSRRMPH